MVPPVLLTETGTMNALDAVIGKMKAFRKQDTILAAGPLTMSQHTAGPAAIPGAEQKKRPVIVSEAGTGLRMISRCRPPAVIVIQQEPSVQIVSLAAITKQINLKLVMLSSAI